MGFYGDFFKGLFSPQPSKDVQVKDEDKVSIPENKNFIFRPRTLDEYIGQNKIKALIKINIHKIKQGKPVHFIFSGNAGCGKTTMSYVVANEIDAEVFYAIGGTVNEKVIAEFLSFCLSSKKIPVFLVDEVHALKVKIAEILYPLLENFCYGDAKVNPFIFIGATTEKNVLMRRLYPLLRRCGCVAEMDNYTPEDIKIILKNYCEQIYPEHKFEEYDMEAISHNCRLTPSAAILLLDDLCICGDIEQVMCSHRIVYNGLKEPEIKILNLMSQTEKPLGEDAIASFAGISTLEYRFTYEPFMIKEGYITRTKGGRMILDKGKKVLNIISEVYNGLPV